jgi:hypothetical protein
MAKSNEETGGHQCGVSQWQNVNGGNQPALGVISIMARKANEKLA